MKKPGLLPFTAGLIIVLALVTESQAQPQLATASVAAFPTVTPDVLAGVIRDQNSNFTIVTDTATVAINNPSVSNPPTDKPPAEPAADGGCMAQHT
jgi:hypothetical protein